MSKRLSILRHFEAGLLIAATLIPSFGMAGVLSLRQRIAANCAALLSRLSQDLRTSLDFKSAGLADNLVDPSMVAGMNVISKSRLRRLSWKDMPGLDIGFKVPGYYVSRIPLSWDIPQFTDDLLNCVGVALVNRQTHTQALVHLVAFSDGEISNQLSKALYQLGPDMIRQSEVYIVPGIDTLTGTGMPEVGIRNYKEARAFLERALYEVDHDPSSGWLYAVDTGIRKGENRIALYQGRLIVPDAVTDWRFSYRQGREDAFMPFSDINANPK